MSMTSTLSLQATLHQSPFFNKDRYQWSVIITSYVEWEISVISQWMGRRESILTDYLKFDIIRFSLRWQIQNFCSKILQSGERRWNIFLCSSANLHHKILNHSGILSTLEIEQMTEDNSHSIILSCSTLPPWLRSAWVDFSKTSDCQSWNSYFNKLSCIHIVGATLDILILLSFQIDLYGF